MKNITIAIIDDHLMFRESMVSHLNTMSGFEVILEAGSGEELQKRMRDRSLVPDVLLLDIELGNDTNGYELATQFKENWPTVRIIVISSHISSYSVTRMLINGVYGFLGKSCGMVDLQKAIHEVHEGNFYQNRYLTGRMIQKGFSSSGAAKRLTESEHQLMNLLVDGVTIRECAKIMHKSARTIEKYRDRLLEKTGCENTRELISFCYSVGLRESNSH